jgi:hypothetical protein
MKTTLKIDLNLSDNTSNFEITNSIPIGISVGVTKNVDLTTFNFTLTVYKNDAVVYQSVFPESGVTLLKTDLDTLTTISYNFIPNTTYKLHIEYNYNNINTVHEYNYTVPKPPQPYPSWTWQNNAWTAPVPLPDDAGSITSGTMYEWDEQNTAWVPLGGYTVE